MSMALEILLLDGMIGYSYRCGVVNLDVSGRLWQVHFDQSGAYGYCLFGVEKKGTQFRLCCWGHDVAEDFADSMDDAIKERGIVIWVLYVGMRVTEVVNFSCPASGFANGEVGGITVDVELHSTGVIFDDRLWMSSQVI